MMVIVGPYNSGWYASSPCNHGYQDCCLAERALALGATMFHWAVLATVEIAQTSYACLEKGVAETGNPNQHTVLHSTVRATA